MDICSVNAFQSMLLNLYYSVTQGNTCSHWLEPSEVRSVIGGYCLLQQSSVVATFAQTSIIITLLLH